MNESDEELEREFRRGTELRDASRFDEAAAVFKNLLERYPGNKGVLVGLGTVYYLSEDYATARQFLEGAVKIAPDSEYLSLMLFFSLAHLRFDEEAMEEMHRFLTIRPKSREYRMIQEEMAEARASRGESG